MKWTRLASAFFIANFGTPSLAQVASCPAGDTPCRVANAITSAVMEFKDRDGVLDFAVGSLCKDEGLKARGRAAYAATLKGVTDSATRNVYDLRLDSEAAAPFLKALPTSVRVARSTEAAGVVAGLESAFAMYPNSRGEYCERVKAAVQNRKP